ncbi:hypothetical protein GC173_19090 [bacterium]|nr:hypothetical protein [bacterium]
MLPTLQHANEDHDDAVVALFALHGLTPPMEFWARAFGEEAPRGAAAVPYVAVEGGRVTGYAVVRKIRCYAGGDLHDGQLFLDLVTCEGPRGDQAARLMLEQIPKESELTFAIGWGAEPQRFLREYHWRFIGALTRWRVDPPRRAPADLLVPPAIDRLPKGFGRTIEQRMAGEGLCFMARVEALEQALAKPTEGCPSELFAVMEGDVPVGYLRVVERPASIPGQRELHLLDARVPAGHVGLLARGLVGLVASRKLPLFAACLAPKLSDALAALGATRLEPRHGVSCSVGAADARELLMGLTSDAPFSLFPADGELDLR